MKLALTAAALLSLAATSTAQMDSVSRSLGLVIGQSVKSQGLPVTDYDAFLDGFKTVLEGRATEADVRNANLAVQASMQEAQAAKSAGARAEGEAFLKQNAEREEVTVTASGLQYEVLQEGAGASPSPTDQVTVHYTGKNLDGSVFDSSVERGEPATFGLNQVIAGWTEGVQLMKPGAKYRFYIPSDLASGERGAGSDIAPGATLIFDVELISIN